MTHYFACNLTTGISSWRYYLYGVSLPIDVQVVIHILYCAYGNLTTWWVNHTTNIISLTIHVDFRLTGLIAVCIDDHGSLSSHHGWNTNLDRSVAVCMDMDKIESSIPILLQCMDIWKKSPSCLKWTFKGSRDEEKLSVVMYLIRRMFWSIRDYGVYATPRSKEEDRSTEHPLVGGETKHGLICKWVELRIKSRTSRFLFDKKPYARTREDGSNLEESTTCFARQSYAAAGSVQFYVCIVCKSRYMTAVAIIFS